MEPTVDLVGSNIFHHVHKFFNHEDRLDLRKLSSKMKDVVQKHILDTEEIHLHENSFSADLIKSLDHASTLAVDTI